MRSSPDFVSAEPARLPERWLPWVRAGWASVALLSAWSFGWIVLLSQRFAADLPERIAAGLSGLGWSPDRFFWFLLLTTAPLFLIGFLMGVMIFWLRQRDRMAVFTSIFLLAFSASNSFPSAPEFLLLIDRAPLVFSVPYFVVGMLSFGLLAVFFATFPDGRFVPRWMRWIAMEGFILSLVWNLFPQVVGRIDSPLGSMTMLAVMVMFGGSMVAQVWRYRHHATTLQKQQTKWFVLGLGIVVVIVLLPAIVLYSLPANSEQSLLRDMIVGLANLAFIFLPVTIGFAILRYRLWDIDIIIRRTLQYTLLTGLLALVYIGGVVFLQGPVRAMTEVAHSPIITVLTTLGVAALFKPLQKRVQEFIDRRFYRQKYNAEQILDHFAAAARDQVDLESLSDALLAAVRQTMQPDRVHLLLKRSPVAARREGNRPAAVVDG